MFFGHGMFDAADHNPDRVFVESRDYRKMFFEGGIRGLFPEKFHFFSATHQGNPGINWLESHIAAMAASVKLVFHSRK